MAQMTVALRTADFNALHTVRGIAILNDGIIADRREKAGPTGPGVIFGAAGEQIRAASAARVNAAIEIMVKCAAKGALGAAFAQDMILFRSQTLTPCVFGKGDFCHRDNVDWFASIFNGQCG